MEHATLDGRVFEAVWMKPYQRLDGDIVDLIVWRGYCCKCGAPFYVSTSVRECVKTNAFESKHCNLHKKRILPRGVI